MELNETLKNLQKIRKSFIINFILSLCVNNLIIIINFFKKNVKERIGIL